ncbi:MAG: ribonuclease HII [Bacilli bacterium]|nr:ribonuclease HII [Bacilli bacterium]
MLNYEKRFYNQKVRLIAGCDEAGRGPIAGPVVAAAVIFPRDYQNEEINDSKKLSAKTRETLAGIIKRDALAYAIIFIDAPTIDKINILEASRLAMEQALHKLKVKYDLVISDAMELYHEKCRVIPLIKADAKVLAVAAASILAKTARDAYMEKLDKEYPQYQFKVHKGYPTPLHLKLLKQYGPIKGVYRFSYKPVKNLGYEQLDLFNC